MMQFAQPLALFALISIPIIIVLHVLRPRRQTLTVSSTSLWTEALRERQRGLGLQKLFRNLSLLLLLLAALIASLALAGPRWLTASNEHQDIVLVLDVSASMQARSGSSTRLDEAKALALQLIDGLPSDGRAIIMTTAGKAVLRSGFERNGPLLRRTLAAIRASDEAGQPREALALATSLLRNRDDGQVYFITDGAFDDEIGLSGARVQYRLVGQGVAESVGANAHNVAITRFDFRTEPGRADRFQVLLSIRNYTDASLTLPTTIMLERRQLFARAVEVAAGTTRTLVMPFAGKSLGRATASIKIDDDLPIDNQAYAVANISDSTHVLLFSPGNFYLQSVLSALPNMQVDLATAEQLTNLEREARRYDVVIFDRVQAPVLAAGNFLLLGNIAPNLNFQSTGSVFQPHILGTGDSALMQGVDLTGVRIDEALKIPLQRSSPGLQRLFWSTDSELALALLDERKRMIVLGFDINRSNFALQAAFPLFITRALEWLHPQGLKAAQTQIQAGAPYAIEAGATHNELIVRAPHGDAQVYRLGNGTKLYDDTSKTGIYRYTVDDVVRYFAVNLTNKQESNIRTRSAEALAQANSAEQASNLAAAQSQHQDNDRADDDKAQVIKALWPQFTLLLLALLLTEWLFWCSGRRHV
jgi:Ca-activated chloride channel family protein